ncbi:MAG TPA: carboxypeptidase regulatory-like domain-containing protein [Bryobacteraceae bacterium]|nr:carboxypeptidase regulatory-like domain-containing protein [Bryobacteraceae bacterium]
MSGKQIALLIRQGVAPLVWTVLLLNAPALFAQFDTASVLGVIRDPSGATVSGAQVTLTNVETGIVAKFVTSATGNYAFVDVKVGVYRLDASAPGFSTSVSENFQVNVDARQAVDLVLQVGASTEKVTVAGAAKQLETESSERSQTIGEQQVVDLPLNGRSYADLTLLTTGVRKGLRDDREGSYNVNGLRFENNNFQLDGVDNNAYATSNVLNSNQVLQIAPDAIEEYRVMTNNYSAEYGHAAGAIINATIRSGTNRFNATLWEFDRNTILNATGFFKPVSGLKPTLHKNQFGAAIGGPIIRDKSFFFIDYEGNRSNTQTIMYSNVPTLGQRQGNLGVPVINPVTSGLYPNGIIPVTDITSFAQKVLAGLPLPNLPSQASNYQSTPAFIDRTDKFDLKLDHRFTDKLNAFVRLSQRKSDEIGNTPIPGPIYGGGLASGASVDGTLDGLNQGMAAALTYVISPTSIIDVHFGITRSKTAENPFGLGGPGMLQLYGIPGLPDGYPGGGLTTQSVNGFTSWGRDSGLPGVQNPMVFDLPRVNYTKIKGRLTFKVGYEYLRYKTLVADNGGYYGSDSYSGQFSKPSGGNANSAIYNLTDFLLGDRSSYSLANPFFPQMEQWMSFGYVQTDFKASPNLTLNLGLRYEFATPQMEAHNLITNLDPVNNSIVYAKAGSIYDRSTIHPDFRNFAPRVGFAYSISDNWVIRSGFGVSFVQFNRLGSEDLLPINFPQTLSLSITQQPSQGLCTGASDFATCFRQTQQGYPLNALVPGNVGVISSRFRYIPADTRTPYVMSWNFDIQRQIAKDWKWDIAYVANRSLKMPVLADYNQGVPNPPLPAPSIPLQNRRPIQSFGNVQIAYGRDDGTYESFQTKLEHRFGNGFYLLDSFTWSKAIDLAPGQLEDVSVGTVVANQNTRINYQNPKSEKGVATPDVPLLNTLSAIWEVPFGHGRRFLPQMHGPVDVILGGWRMAVINSMYSGNPITFIYSPSSDYTVSSDSKDYRPDLIGDPFLPSDQRTWYHYWNPNGLEIPPSRTMPFGDAGRNIARSPGVYTVDVSMQKEVHLPLRDSTRLQFRAEAFNIQNRTNFQNANSVVGNSAFGQIQSTYPARQVQLALKVYF